MGFLNLLLEPEVAISDIRYINTELLGDHPDLKRCVVDVLATDDQGNRYLIEMQNASDHDIRERLIYYACRLVDQMGQHRKEWEYEHIKRVYAICLMNFTYEQHPSLREDYQLRNAKGDKLFSDLLTIIPLQLPCIRAKSASDCRKSYEVLLYLLQSMSKRMRTREEMLAEIEGIDLPEPTLEMFRRVINTVEDDLTEDQWRDYELDLDKYQRTMSVIRTGRSAGRAEGRAEGLAEGRAEGRAERELEIAKAMKQQGLSMELIARCTGMPETEIESL